MQKKEIKGRRPNRTTKSTTNKRYTSSKATQIKRRHRLIRADRCIRD